MTPAPRVLMGGTYDPVHWGHIRLAESLLEPLQVSRIGLMPAGQPMHRQSLRTPACHRLAMLQAALADHAQLYVEAGEALRAEPTYTVQTLRRLRQEQPQTAIWLIMGMDALLGLHQWREPEALLEMAHVVVAARPGYSLSGELPHALQRLLQGRLVPTRADLLAHPAGKILTVRASWLAISATAVRQALQRGEDVHTLVPKPVLEYISAHQLYSSKETT